MALGSTVRLSAIDMVSLDWDTRTCKNLHNHLFILLCIYLFSLFTLIILLVHNYIEYSILLALIFNALVLVYIDVIFFL